MNKKQSLELINSLEIIDCDADGEVLIYALIENTEENKAVLLKAGVSEEDIESATDYDGGWIDLTAFVWNYAEWFDGHKFLSERNENTP